jgi:transcriptional regulator with XRE-family HTH domain
VHGTEPAPAAPSIAARPTSRRLPRPYNVFVGQVLREIREGRRLSRWAVEEDTLRQVKHRDLAEWEAGRREMRVGTLGRLCAFYRVPTAVVLDRADARYRASLKPAVAAWHARLNERAG